MSMYLQVTFRFLLSSIVLAALMVSTALAADLTTVKVESGVVHGIAAADVISFKGIPYAAPPIGELRWRVPQPVRPWEGVREASKFGPACMQTDDLPKSEDCLTINVWRPTKDSREPYPVMVWIYGGALVRGNTALYPGDALAAQGLVVISMNYRLGRLGFFAHPALAEESPGEPIGNYGYMDQLAALKWVQRNIAAFGGDPNKLTIFGESAGGGSVMSHLVSPLSRGLFRAAILESPGIPTGRVESVPATPLAEAEATAVAYARYVGVNRDGAGALKALRALPAEMLVEGASGEVVLTSLGNGQRLVGLAGSIIDGKFLTDSPEAVFKAGGQAMVPMIIGANDRDLVIGEAVTKEDLFALFGDYAAEARAIYDSEGSETLEELKQQVLADRTLVEPSRNIANLAATGGQPTWHYRFSYVAEALRSNPKWKGAPHGMEIPYVFGIPAAIVRDKVTNADKEMAKLASAYWVAFAKTGDPNGESRPAWPRHNPSVDSIINFTNGGIVVGPDPLKARLDLWQKVFDANK
ncbi:para-nitrobenzyl esterase [Phyllobacterium trifolii]|uniref:Carboxylic ester hydrolase n=2 Tax=Phyllobacterium trifolii TaxID=300193 RepID=A0A839UCP5_9HYPH|nr:para-nitrobenzyl esterase [Phyllobacterium trifolii]